MSYKKYKQEIIEWAKALNRKGLVTAKNGNISYKVEDEKVLITAHDAYLGYLEDEEIILVDLEGNILEGNSELTTEKNLHLSIHNKFRNERVVIHAHSPYSTAFFHYFDKIDIFSFEAKFYLGDIKAISQETPAVTELAPVLEALENSNIIVLKNHGVVSMGSNFKEVFSLLELLEEQAKVNLLIKSSKVSQSQASPERVNKDGSPDNIKNKHKMLSKEHMQQLREVINNDQEVQELGQKYDLTCTLAVKNQDNDEAMCFHYERGKIIKIDRTDKADFVIIGKEEILKKVFNRQIDPFVALTQGKVKSKGNFAKMSKWYPVMVRTFKLWEQAPVE